MSDKILQNIQELLEDIKAILLLTNNSKLQETKKELLKEGSEQQKIYELCDGKTAQEIATALQKSAEYVGSNISILRRKGLVKTVERDGKKVNEQRF
jgi:DNA-binding NarL/FixJ family response regulator